MPYDIAQRSCRQADGTEGSYVLRKRSSGEQVSCHVSRAAAESARRIRLRAEKESGGTSKESSVKASQEEIDQRYEEFQDAVNMNASEIEEWGKDDCADQASENPQQVRDRVVGLLRTPKEEWGESEYEAAGRVISFVSRMSGVQGGDAPSDDCPSKRTISLRNWGFDPNKSAYLQTSTESTDTPSGNSSKRNPRPMQDPLINFGGGLKVLGSGKQHGKDPSGPRVGGYAIVYTGPNDLDLDGQFFSKDTDFWLPQGNEGFVWPIYGHGQDPTLKNKRFSSEPWKVHEDDAGLWMEGQLEIADKYDEMVLEKGIKPGKMGLSTGALSHLVSVSRTKEGPDGAEHIDDWPVYENSITPQPSEFRTKLGLEVKEHGIRRLGDLPMPGVKAVCTEHSSKISTGGYRAGKEQHSYSEGDLVAWEGGDAQGRVVTVSTSGTASGSMEPEGTTHETSEENPGYIIQLVDREDGEIVGRTDENGNPQTVFHRAGSLMSITEEEVSQKESAEESLPEDSPLKELEGFADSLTEQIEASEGLINLNNLASSLSDLRRSLQKGSTLGRNLAQQITATVEANKDMSQADVISEMASEAEIEESTVRSILGGSPEIKSLSRAQLEGFARTFGIDPDTVVGWARSDGWNHE